MNTIFENWRIDQLFEELWATATEELRERPEYTNPDDEFDKETQARLDRNNPLQTPEQAAKLLGISLGASKGEIKKAFRKTMMASHPDRGGTPVDGALLQRAVKILNKHAESGGGQAQDSTTPEPSNDKSELYNTIIQAMGKAFAPPQAAVAEGKQKK
jgi:hypothetical protein